MQVKDQLGRILTFQSRPGRIISLVPSQTELLVDLGLRDYLVGVTKFCVHPTELRKQTTVVGGTKNVHFDRIAALKPEIIIANKEENTLQMVQQLEEIAPVWVSDIYTLQDSLNFIAAMGQLFALEEKATDIIAGISRARAAFLSAAVKRTPKNVAYLIWKTPYMAAGRATFINDMLGDNKFVNIISDPLSRYPEITLVDLKKADLVLLSSEPYPFREADRIALEDSLGIPVKLVDGEYFSWYGSRLAKAYEYFRRLQ